MPTDAIFNTWGLPLPVSVPFGWGARLIHPVDVVWDRQGLVGDWQLAGTKAACPEADALVAWLNTTALPYLRAVEAYGEGLPRRDEDREVTVSGDGFTLRANPRRSYGYLYVVAYPDPSATGPTPPRPLSPKEKTAARRSEGARKAAATRKANAARLRALAPTLPWTVNGTDEVEQRAVIAQARTEGRSAREALDAFRTGRKPEVYVVHYADDGKVRLYSRQYSVIATATSIEASALVTAAITTQTWDGYAMEGRTGRAVWLAAPGCSDAERAS